MPVDTEHTPNSLNDDTVGAPSMAAATPGECEYLNYSIIYTQI